MATPSVQQQAQRIARHERRRVYIIVNPKRLGAPYIITDDAVAGWLFAVDPDGAVMRPIPRASTGDRWPLAD